METNLLSLISFAGIASASAAILLGIQDLLFPRRSKVAEAKLLKQLPRKSIEGGSGPIARFDYWFGRTLYLSGLNLSAATAMLLLVLFASAIGGAIFVATDNAVLSGVGVLSGVVGVIVYVWLAYRRRVKRFYNQFPAALDLLARAVRAGESLDQAIELVANSIGEPVSTEFRRCARQLEMGLSIAATMQAFSQRMQLMDVRIFASTLAVHREAGGNLGQTLERLAAVIRERADYRRQLRSVTGAGRLGVVLISALGPVLFAYLFLFQPEYGRGLWEDPVGRSLLIFAVCSEIAGLLWVSRLLKADY